MGKVIILVLLYFICFFLAYNVISNNKFFGLIMFSKLKKSSLYERINNRIEILKKYDSSFIENNRINFFSVFFFSVILSMVVFCLSISTTKIFSTSLILALIFLAIPYVIINIIIQININKIKTALPSYIVNLKSNLEVNNNIIKSMRITKVEKPLKDKIDIFNSKVNRGINVHKCFDDLKKDVNIQTFSSIINAFKICYSNGGDYINVLNKYIDITSKEIMEKSKLRENSNTTIITLIIMIVMNIFLLLSMILGNNDYRYTILKTTGGHVIINFGIISYVIIGYLIYKIYKMEG